VAKESEHKRNIGKGGKVLKIHGATEGGAERVEKLLSAEGDSFYTSKGAREREERRENKHLTR